MQVIGLTGSSGAGKSAAADIFRTFGIPILDADAIYHALLLKHGDCTNELTATFGNDILDEKGLVSRERLAATVFGKPNTPALLHTLNKVTHKYVMSELKKGLADFKARGVVAAVIDAPLLFEANAHLECDFVIGIIANKNLREARIMARDSLSKEAAEKRLNAQKSDDFYRERCDYILENNADKADLQKALTGLLLKTGVLKECVNKERPSIH